MSGHPELLLSDGESEHPVSHTEVTALLQDSNVLSVQPFLRSSNAIKIIKSGRFITAIFFAGTSIIAVMAVPYLTMRSVYYITTRDASASFHEIMRSNNLLFWLFGPTVSILATIAIAPFNMYNAYTLINDMDSQKLKQLATPKGLLKTLLQFWMLLSGIVNGYNTSLAFRDVIGQHTPLENFAHHVAVFIAVIFAGIGDSKTLSHYIYTETTRDLRRLGRGINRVTSFIPESRYSLFSCLSDRARLRNKKLQKIKFALDDLHEICQLGLSYEQLEQFSHVVQRGISVEDNATIQQYFQLLQQGFPKARFVGSEIVGSLFSLLWAYFGNRNSLEYAYVGAESFLNYCGVTNNLVILLLCSFSAFSAFMVGSFLSFFLIRDLFFRELFKSKQFAGIGSIFERVVLPTIPALCMGLVNVILTIMNPQLNPIEMIITATAAVVGATVVSRYGIDNGVRELRGKKDLRRILANVGPALMENIQRMDDEKLSLFYQQIEPFISEFHIFNRRVVNDQARDKNISENNVMTMIGLDT